MNVLVVGANGLLGSNVVDKGRDRGHTVVGTYHTTEPDFQIPLHQFNVRDTDRFEGILEQYAIDLVINCVALTDVDECERRPNDARAVNGDTPGELASIAAKCGIEFTHISTDYVFDGRRRSPYTESDITNPTQEYGRSKQLGEERVRDIEGTSVLRLSFVYGIHRATGCLSGFPAWVRAELRAGNKIPLFTDQFVTPSRAGHIAATVFDLYDVDADGFFHVACTDCVTPFEFGAEVADQLGLEPTFMEGSTDDIARDAPRPTYTCLDTTKIEDELERPQPSLSEDLATLFAELH